MEVPISFTEEDKELVDRLGVRIAATSTRTGAALDSIRKFADMVKTKPEPFDAEGRDAMDHLHDACTMIVMSSQDLHEAATTIRDLMEAIAKKMEKQVMSQAQGSALN